MAVPSRRIIRIKLQYARAGHRIIYTSRILSETIEPITDPGVSVKVKQEIETDGEGGWTKEQICSLLKSIRTRPVLYDSATLEPDGPESRQTMLLNVAQEVSNVRPKTTIKDILDIWKKLSNNYEIENKRILEESRRTGGGIMAKSGLYYYDDIAFLEKDSKKRFAETMCNIGGFNSTGSKNNLSNLANPSHEIVATVTLNERGQPNSSTAATEATKLNPNERDLIKDYGGYVAHHLKRLSEEDQLETQATINEVLYYALKKQKVRCVKV